MNIKTPELDKRRACLPASRILSDFLDWLRSNEARGLCEIELLVSEEALLAAYFELDLKKIDKEQTVLLDEQRKLNEKAGAP